MKDITSKQHWKTRTEKILDSIMDEDKGYTSTVLYGMVLEKAAKQNDKAITRSLTHTKLVRILMKDYSVVGEVRNPRTSDFVNLWGI